MGRRIILGCLCCVAAGLTSGCVTSPPTGEGMGSTYSVGDKGQLSFQEVVVSLTMRRTTAPYQNLHVTLVAFLNPTRKTTVSAFEAQTIVQRCEARMAVRVSQALGSQGEKSIADGDALRQIARDSAQAVVDDAMKQWEHGSEYRAEIAVSSLYWTDASVGIMPRPMRGLW